MEGHESTMTLTYSVLPGTAEVATGVAVADNVRAWPPGWMTPWAN